MPKHANGAALSARIGYATLAARPSAWLSRLHYNQRHPLRLLPRRLRPRWFPQRHPPPSPRLRVRQPADQLRRPQILQQQPLRLVCLAVEAHAWPRKDTCGKRQKLRRRLISHCADWGAPKWQAVPGHSEGRPRVLTTLSQGTCAIVYSNACERALEIISSSPVSQPCERRKRWESTIPLRRRR